MEPVKFKEVNLTFAEDQPEYLPLPVWKNPDTGNEVVSCWKASVRERFKILFSGRIYLTLLSFNKPLTPNRIFAENPIKYYQDGE